jgi:pimeloyl-ACP methyl ester carboxylesterase
VESKDIDLGRVSMNYGDSGGSGPEVVFFHGYPARWEAYEPLLELLALDFRVFAPSMRGMGRSGRADSYCVADFIGDISAFLRTVSSTPTMVVGQGGGPWFAAAAAAKEPDLIAALVSMDEPFSPERNIADNKSMLPMRWATAEALRRAATFDEFLDLFADVPIGGGATVRSLGEERLRVNAEISWTLDPDTLAHWESMETMRAFLDVPELPALPGEYRGPVLFISGDPESDLSCTHEDNENNLRQYPWAELTVLPGTDTFTAMREDPAMLASHVTAFLKRVTEARE